MKYIVVAILLIMIAPVSAQDKKQWDQAMQKRVYEYYFFTFFGKREQKNFNAIISQNLSRMTVCTAWAKLLSKHAEPGNGQYHTMKTEFTNHIGVIITVLQDLNFKITSKQWGDRYRNAYQKVESMHANLHSSKASPEQKKEWETLSSHCLQGYNTLPITQRRGK